MFDTGNPAIRFVKSRKSGYYCNPLFLSLRLYAVSPLNSVNCIGALFYPFGFLFHNFSEETFFNHSCLTHLAQLRYVTSKLICQSPQLITLDLFKIRKARILQYIL